MQVPLSNQSGLPNTCRICRAVLTQFNTHNYTSRSQYICIECDRKRCRDNAWKLKLDVIAAYGGACACCKISEHIFLTIDHIHGGGAQDRKENALAKKLDVDWSVVNRIVKKYAPTKTE